MSATSRGSRRKERERPDRSDAAGYLAPNPEGRREILPSIREPRYMPPDTGVSPWCRSARGGPARPQAIGPLASGSLWTGWPVSWRQALATAGPIGGTPGSPTPVGGSVESMIATSTSGISLMRSER